MDSLVIAVVGSRSFGNPDAARAVVEAAVARIAATHPTATIVSGGTPGTDTWAETAARRYGLPCRVIRADWDTHGRIAGHLRNTELVRLATHVLAFWDGRSPGTRDTLTKARAAGKPVGLWQEK